jgi:hypothetical protein
MSMRIFRWRSKKAELPCRLSGEDSRRELGSLKPWSKTSTKRFRRVKPHCRKQPGYQLPWIVFPVSGLRNEFGGLLWLSINKHGRHWRLFGSNELWEDIPRVRWSTKLRVIPKESHNKYVPYLIVPATWNFILARDRAEGHGIRIARSCLRRYGTPPPARL